MIGDVLIDVELQGECLPLEKLLIPGACERRTRPLCNQQEAGPATAHSSQRLSGPEGGYPLGRDLDGEHVSLKCGPFCLQRRGCGFARASQGNGLASSVHDMPVSNGLSSSLTGLFAGLADAFAGVVEVHLVLLDADKSLSGENAGDSGSAAAHEGVEDGIGLHRVAKESHLRQRARAGHRVVAFVAVIGSEVVDMPVAGQVVAQE